MTSKRQPKRKPAITDEGRESQMVSLAVDLAEKQLADGTASSQVITHFLKMGSTREKLEQERLVRENALLESKVEAMASAKRIEELYEEAIISMRLYSGTTTEEDLMDDEYDN